MFNAFIVHDNGTASSIADWPALFDPEAYRLDFLLNTILNF